MEFLSSQRRRHAARECAGPMSTVVQVRHCDESLKSLRLSEELHSLLRIPLIGLLFLVAPPGVGIMLQF